MKKNNKKGFTLVELVIVVAVMAVLVAVAIPTIGSIKSTAETNVNNSNAQTVESMIKLAEADGATSVAQYLYDAKLGVTGNFMYNEDTGECEYTESTTDSNASDNIVLVSFAEVSNVYTVTYDGTSVNAPASSGTGTGNN